MARKGLDAAAVIAAAAHLTDEIGFDDLTLARVAEQLGVRIPSLYNHVAGLDGLRRGVILYSFRAFAEVIRASVIGKAGDVAIMALGDAYRAFAKEHAGLYAATIAAPKYWDAEIIAVGDSIVATLVAVLADYHLHDIAAIHAVRALRSIAHGFVALEATGNFGMPIDLNASFHRLLQLYIGGLHQAAREGLDTETTDQTR